MCIRDRNGKLVYVTSPNGDRVPDFSYCGYMSGGVRIPDAPIRIVVPAKPGDSTDRIQRAIDTVSSLSPDENGIRGAVLLQPGTHEVLGSLIVRTSGVILRGCGAGAGAGAGAGDGGT